MPFADPAARRAYQREYYRIRNRLKYRRFVRAGACGVCGVPSGRFRRCVRHRVRAAARKRERRFSQ